MAHDHVQKYWKCFRVCSSINGNVVCTELYVTLWLGFETFVPHRMFVSLRDLQYIYMRKMFRLTEDTHLCRWVLYSPFKVWKWYCKTSWKNIFFVISPCNKISCVICYRQNFLCCLLGQNFQCYLLDSF
jgi:hypothetical protein